MKAIQIGDWLQHANGKYYQVTRIDRLGDGNIHFACGFPRLWEYNNKFEPIPLKKLHLTKNGFKPTDETDMRFVYRDGYEIKVMIDEYIRDSMFLSIEFAEKNIWMPIEYVHELQHAMRLFGIEKEIKL